MLALAVRWPPPLTMMLLVQPLAVLPVKVVPAALSSDWISVALQVAIAVWIAVWLAGIVVVVVVAPLAVEAFAGTGGTSARTGRSRSCAVRPTRRNAFAWSFTPGSSTTMSLPCWLMLGSATPKVLTRLLMIFSVSLSAEALGWPIGSYVTEIPPLRSRPSTGAFPDRIVAPMATITTTTDTRR